MRISVSMTSTTTTLPAVPASAAAARQVVSGLVRSQESARVTALLVSELVTMALLEGALEPSDTITIHVDPVADGLRVTVCDSAASSVAPGADVGAVEVHRHGGPTGLGLRIVARLARRWGVASEHPGARAWFEVGDAGDDGPPAAPPAA
ncbi:MAG: ATP-binding protein [Solirubrobacterales bacterium]|nr:ATP-binding protein [Solirubrobacterales bacterium]